MDELGFYVSSTVCQSFRDDVAEMGAGVRTIMNLITRYKQS